MGRRSDRRSDINLRTTLAQEAARLITDHGFDDFRSAKSKAAEIMGLRNYGALPTNREIEFALAERNRIFSAERHPELLSLMRLSAATVMRSLDIFRPRLVGAVLSGNITEHSPITLHLFSEPAEAVGQRLAASGIHHGTVLQRLKLRRDRVEEFPGYRFYADDFEVNATVFPERRKQHAPLSPVDGKPMKRAKLQEVELLATAG
jgi:hypothetical protein